MKHFWMGLGLLLGLLGLSVWAGLVVEDIHAPLQRDLDAAAEAVLDGDWAEGTALAEKARAGWEQDRNTIAALSSHAAIEEMDRLFRQLAGYARAKDPVVFATVCRDLASLAAATTEAQKLTWWNLL